MEFKFQWLQIQLNLTQIPFLRSGIQIGAKDIENLLMIMVLKKGKTLKRHRFKMILFHGT
jgi:hypothetical protein